MQIQLKKVQEDIGYGFFNPNWHELREQEKCSSLGPPRSTLYEQYIAFVNQKLKSATQLKN